MLFCFSSFGQSTQDAQESTISLKSALGQLEEEFNIRFSFDPNEIKGVKVNRVTSTQGLENKLKDILRSTKLEFNNVDGRFYVIKEVSSKFIQFQITDSETNQPLPFTIIRQKETNLGVVTDENGMAKLVVSRPKGVVLEVLYLGFEDLNIGLDTVQSLSILNLKLQPEPLDLNDYEVKEYLNPGIASDPKANSFKILPQEMEILPGLAERDVLLSAQIISGVNSNDESASGINIRGSSRDNTLLYWNNVPVYHTAHYFGSISSFIPSSIGKLDVYKNYVPVMFGGASAGLIALESRNDVDNTVQAELSLNMTHGDAFVKTPLFKNKSSLMMAARRSYNDAIPTWTYNAYGEKLFGREIRDRQGIIYRSDFSNDLNFSDINLSWNYEPSDRTTINLSYLRSRSRFDYNESDLEQRRNIEQEHNVSSTGAGLSADYRLSDKQSIFGSLTFSNYQMDYEYINVRNPNLDADDDIQQRSNSVRNLEARVAHSQIIGKQNTLSFGYQFNSFDIENLINTQNFFEEDNAEEINSKSSIHAVFADFNLNPTENLELVFSGRLTHIESLQRTVFSPQFKLNYNIKPDFLLKTTYGVYHQYLSTIKESQFTISNAVEQHWLLADTDELVPLVVNKQLSFGFIHNRGSWLLDFDLFTKNIDGLLARNLGFGFTREDGFNQGSERIFGLDLTLRKRWQYFKSWFSYNFQDSEVSFNRLFPNSFASNLNIRHQLNFSNSYTKGNWEFSFGYTFKSGAPYTSINNIRLDRRNTMNPPPNLGPGPGPGPGNNGDFGIVFSRPNGLRVGNYHRFDTSVWHRFQGEKWRGEVGLSLINLFNRTNVYNIGYLIDFNRDGEIVIVERTKFFLTFTPNFSIRFTF